MRTFVDSLLDCQNDVKKRTSETLMMTVKRKASILCKHVVIERTLSMQLFRTNLDGLSRHFTCKPLQDRFFAVLFVQIRT